MGDQDAFESAGGTRPIRVKDRAGTEVTVPRVTVTVESGPDRDSRAVLGSTSLRIGTAPENELVLGDDAVSRRHAILTLTPEGILVEDQASRNGVWIGGTRIRSAFVPEGGRFQVGRTTIRVGRSDRRFRVVSGDASLGEMLGESAAMRSIFALATQLARTDLPVLITGETGTGKELLARALHDSGPRHDRPFLVLDCGAIVPDLLRSEIFGHEKGAFTGADRTTRGILEEAEGGTVHLDEVGEIDASVQPQLLRALETRQICRLGSRRPIPVDVRVVAATNRDLRKMCRDGGFRSDLYYRLACVTIRLPPLRERAEDVKLLARGFLRQCAARHGLAEPEITAEAMELLERHPWPGNVRELRNVVEAACVLSGGSAIDAKDLAPHLERDAAVDAAGGPLERAEREAIARALAETGWNRRAAARRLGVSHTTLYEKIRRHALSPGR
jgi:DNA-binding NtrC family response regulator